MVRRTGFALVLLTAIAACSGHQDLPPMLAVTSAPTPSNFTVMTSNNIVYDLSWTNSDPALVAYYNLYIDDPFTGQTSFVDSTSATTAQIDTQIPTQGLVFGVASVSVGNIESALAKASAP